MEKKVVYPNWHPHIVMNINIFEKIKATKEKTGKNLLIIKKYNSYSSFTPHLLFL